MKPIEWSESLEDTQKVVSDLHALAGRILFLKMKGKNPPHSHDHE